MTPLRSTEPSRSAVSLLRACLRIYAALEMSGLSDTVLKEAVSYAKQREQFGRVIGSFQAVKHILADSAALTVSLSSLCGQTLAGAVRNPESLYLDSLTLNAYASRVARQVVENALQVHGGIGFTEEFDL